MSLEARGLQYSPPITPIPHKDIMDYLAQISETTHEGVRGAFDLLKIPYSDIVDDPNDTVETVHTLTQTGQSGWRFTFVDQALSGQLSDYQQSQGYNTLLRWKQSAQADSHK